jgi:hypothetical protein
MYMSRVIEIGKAQNGFVVSCNVPIKQDAKKSGKMETCCCPGSCDREYVAKDAKEVCDLIEDIMPLLDTDYTTEEEFDKAFEDATGSMEDEKGEK